MKHEPHSYKGANHVTKEMALEWWTSGQTRKTLARLKSKPNSEPFEVAQFSTFGVHDKDGTFYDFYELEFINPKSEQ